MDSYPSEAALRLTLAQKAAVGRVVTAAEMDMILAWMQAWDALSADLERLITQSLDPSLSQITRAARAREALRIVSMELQALAEQAGVRITEDASRLIMAAIADTEAAIAVQRPFAVAFDRPDRAQIAAMVARTTERIHSRKWPLTRDAEAAMKRALTGGVAEGRHPREVARRMVGDVRGAFNGGLARARNIARTELLDAHRAAAAATRAKNREVVTGWMWVAELSSRTCPACWAMHGSTHPPEVEGPWGHPSCRCVSVPTTKSWADLGFEDIPEVPAPVPDAEAVFERLSEAEQRRVLGPARYEAWLRGDYPIGDWAVTVPNPGWRDSVRTSPAPTVGRPAIAA